MNLHHLRYFVTLAHLEHYAKASEVLCITQPSLTYAISSLENELGVKLFEKDGRNNILTKYGNEFLKDVEQSLNILDSSINKLQITGKGEGQIDIAMLRTLSTHIVPGFARGFLDSNPQKNIHLKFHNSTGMTLDILRELKERKYDIAFCSIIENEPSVEFIPIARQKLVVIVPEKHPLADKKEIELSEMLPYPQIAFSKQSGLRPIIDELFKKCGGHPTVVNTVAEDQSIAGLVSANFGIAVVPDMEILYHLPIKIINILSPRIERIFYMATLKDVYEAPVVKDFKKYVIEKAAMSM